MAAIVLTKINILIMAIKKQLKNVAFRFFKNNIAVGLWSQFTTQ